MVAGVPLTAAKAPLTAAWTGCASAKAPLTRRPGEALAGSATLSVASPAGLVTVAGRAPPVLGPGGARLAVEPWAVAGVKGPKRDWAPGGGASVAGTVAPALPW